VNVAIIPARGGSKRIPRKNIRDFRGKPMIAWSIEAAIRSECFDRIIVSTDDEEVAQVAARSGAETPFRRPAELSSDHAGTIPVIAHAVKWLAAAGAHLVSVCCLYATAPLVLAEDIRRGKVMLATSDVDYVFACTTFDYPVQRALTRDVSGRVAMLFPDHESSRSQDLVETFHDAGQFYWGRARAWAEARPVYGERSLPLMIPRHRVQDIDTIEDWTRAELIHRVLCEQERERS
jgi:N-acylneuraminate cytidylyltransferase